MSDLPTSRDVHALNVAGRFQEALALVDQLPDTGVHLWLRGVALYNLGRADEAHTALDRARLLLTGDNLGRMLNDQATYYTHDQRYARALETLLQAVDAARQDPVMRVVTAYNLGWQYLSRLQFTPAHRHLDAAYRLGEAGPVSERMVPRIGLSTLNRASGHLEAARSLAVSATDAAAGHRSAHLAYRCLAHAYRHLGDLDGARRAQGHAAHLAVTTATVRTEHLILGIIDAERGDDIDLEALQAGAAPLDVTRALLHRAEQARRAGADAHARHLLLHAVAQDEPFALWDEAPHLPALYTWAGTHGVTLPERVHVTALPVVHVTALGRPRVSVAAREITDVSTVAVTLLAYVIVNGQTRLAELDRDLYGSIGAKRADGRVTSAVRTINRWLGDPAGVLWDGSLLRLSTTWTWSIDVQDVLTSRERPRNRMVLPGARADWVNRVQRQIDDLFT